MKHILVAVAGSSPAIITETLWALKKEHAITVDEVRIITTAEGEQAIQESLLQSGEWAGCCVACGYNPALAMQIETLRDGDGDLDDIRTTTENELAANQIYQFIRTWTDEKDTTLHCSIAGGRKVMSAYLSNALMLCARAEDKAYHVLVSPAEFEKYQGFYYPFAGVVTLRDAGGREHNRNASDASIELAEIYFVKLRELLSDSMLEGLTTYKEIVGRVQKYLLMLEGNAEVRIRQAKDTAMEHVVVTIADCDFDLSPMESVLYVMLAQLRKNSDKENLLEEISGDAIRQAYKTVMGTEFAPADTEGTQLDKLPEWIRLAENNARVFLSDTITHVRTRVNNALAWVPNQYKIGRRTYLIDVRPEQIHLPE